MKRPFVAVPRAASARRFACIRPRLNTKYRVRHRENIRLSRRITHPIRFDSPEDIASSTSVPMSALDQRYPQQNLKSFKRKHVRFRLGRPIAYAAVVLRREAGEG